MISTVISTSCGIVPGASSDAAGCRVRTAAPVANPAMKAAVYRPIKADQDFSSFVEGQLWLRPTTLDVLVPTTPGHHAWRPPT